MQSSNFSKSVFSINAASPPTNFEAKFVYNFYTTDESTQDVSDIPEIYKKSTLQKSDVNLVTFSLKTPRYIELSWQIPQGELSQGDINNNLNKITTQDNILSSKHIPYFFSNYDALDHAYEDIKKDATGELLTSATDSQASIIENYINELMKDYEEVPEKPKKEATRNLIKESISSIEKFADNPEKTIGYKFYDENQNKITNSALDKVALLDTKFYSQINVSIAKDIFFSASLPPDTVTKLQNLSEKLINSNQPEALYLEPVFVGEEINNDNNNILFEASSTQIIGYVIEKFKFQNNTYTKEKTIVCENANINSILDVNVKYGAKYHYVLRSVAKFTLPTVIDGQIKKCIYYLGGKPTTVHVTCTEDVPPPEPAEINFSWDYKQNKFFVTWQMPFNSQRDIKQFQIFRRQSINEPFELLEQQCFDFSDIKSQTGELIDGNKNDMTKDNKSFVKYFQSPTFSYNDKDFKVDAEIMKTSKYIYCIASIDAHGLISNYSAQFEVMFDFFKNTLVKKLISNAGAPRPYPNLLLNIDAFKDVIQTSGMSSKKLKIYFMPEYFAVKYNSGRTQRMLTTKQDGLGGYYKLQFINTQNQKTDSLKINIDDPNNLVPS